MAICSGCMLLRLPEGPDSARENMLLSEVTMTWKKMLAYVTGEIEESLLLRIEYLTITATQRSRPAV